MTKINLDNIIEKNKVDEPVTQEKCRYYYNDGAYCGYIDKKSDLNKVMCQYIDVYGMCKFKVPIIYKINKNE